MSMNPRIEIGEDGQSILWQRHLLTDVMESSRLDALTLEPLLNAAGTGSEMFKVEIGDSSVGWQWGRWSRVEIRAGDAGEAGPPQSYSPPHPTSLGWGELPVASAVELTFYGTDGLDAGCVKVAVPVTAAFGRGLVFTQPRGGNVEVRLPDARDSATCSVERLMLAPGEEFRPKGSPIVFRQGESQARVPVDLSFFGIIALIRTRRGQRKLLGYATYNGTKTSLPNLNRDEDARLFQRLRRWIEGGAHNARPQAHTATTNEEWLDNWPSNSRKRLRDLYEQAQRHLGVSGDGAYKVLREYPTGLARYLTLFHCGYKSSSSGAEKIIPPLDGGSFQAALKGVLPHLEGALSGLTAIEEKVWAIRHAENPNLAEAAAYAAGQGVSALQRALHLLEKRSQACAAWEARRTVNGSSHNSTSSSH